MSLFKYAAAAALGYYLGQPSGRRQLDRLRERATELWQSPKAREVKERSWDMAGERVSATTKAVLRRTRNGDTDEQTGTTSPVVPEQSVPDRPDPGATVFSEDLQSGVLPPPTERPVR